MSGFFGTPNSIKWSPIASAPKGRDIQVQVSDHFGEYPLPFSCRLTEKGWVNAETRKPLKIKATGWRDGRTLPRPKRTVFGKAQASAG